MFTTILLSILTGTGHACGMGFFFLISAYFTPGSYDHKGPVPFLRDRLLRLGIQLLLYDLLLDPLVVYIARGLHGSYWSFYSSDYLLHVRTIGPGPAWFIEALLLFTLLYVAWRGLTSYRLHTAASPGKLPDYRAICGFIFALDLVSFVVRVWYLIGRWIQPFDLELALYQPLRPWSHCLSPQLVLRTLCQKGKGLVVDCHHRYRHRRYSCDDLLYGGWRGCRNPVDTLWVVSIGKRLSTRYWESFVVVGVCIGLLVLFRTRWNRQGRLAKGLAANAYTVYLIHPLVIVSFASAFHAVTLYPLLKFVIVVLITLPLCFLISNFIRKIPLADKVS